MPDWRSQFEEHYSQYLDSALVLAIVNDCENSDSAKDVLELLKNDGQCLTHEDGWNQSTTREKENEILHSLDDEFNKEHEVDYSEELTNSLYDLDETVYNFLRSMFHDIAPQRVQYVLYKCENDLTRASDELLNQEVLEKNEGLRNATDALFAAPNVSHRSRQRKRKNKKPNASRRAPWKDDLYLSNANKSDTDEELAQFTANKLSFWERNQQLFEKISSILDIANSRVSHEFYKHSGSLYFTVNALLRKHPLLTETFEKSCQDTASELSKNTGLAFQFCCELITCSKDLQGAKWIAYAVKQSQPKDTTKLELGLLGNEKPKASQLPSLSRNMSERDDSVETYSAEECNRLADEYLDYRNAEYAASARDYRRSRSDRLLGGSAAYHAQVGRQYHEKAMKWRGLAMRSLVQTGTPYSLDLHGATVREAKSIVEERVSSWWAKEADSSPNCIHPFRIITGIGNHSVGMEARLLPSIVRWLQQNGWRFEVNHGQVEVYGAIIKKKK